MDDRPILDIAPRADDDPIEIAAQHAVVPDAGAGPDLDVADQARTGRDESCLVYPRRPAAVWDDGRAGVPAHACGLTEHASLGNFPRTRHADRVRLGEVLLPHRSTHERSGA